MRVSTETLNNMSINSMQNSYGDYSKILQKLASNKNFTKLSENITDGIDVIKIKEQLSEIDQYQGNIQHAINEMDLAYDTLGDVTDELSLINGLIIKAADATTTEDSAKAIASELSQRVETVRKLMNTKYLDNYIFSGTYIQQKPYVLDEETGNITYEGSSAETGERNVTIAEGTKFFYNFTGEEIFGAEGDANEFFAQMKDLEKLLNNEDGQGIDHDGIRAKLDVVQKAESNVSTKQGVVSAKVQKLITTQNINTDTSLNLTEKRANLEEVDVIKAASDLANANTAMQASYMLGARVLSSVSLLDYI